MSRQVQGKKKTYIEAIGEPGMAIQDMTAVVPAVVASTHNPLVAFHIFPERLLAAREDDTHGSSSGPTATRSLVVKIPVRAIQSRGLGCLRCSFACALERLVRDSSGGG